MVYYRPRISLLGGFLASYPVVLANILCFRGQHVCRFAHDLHFRPHTNLFLTRHVIASLKFACFCQKFQGSPDHPADDSPHDQFATGRSPWQIVSVLFWHTVKNQAGTLCFKITGRLGQRDGHKKPLGLKKKHTHTQTNDTLIGQILSGIYIRKLLMILFLPRV